MFASHRVVPSAAAAGGGPRRKSIIPDASPTNANTNTTSAFNRRDSNSATAPSAGNSNAQTAATTTPVPPKVRVGELYWKQDGPYGWTLGQVVALLGSGTDTADVTAPTTAKWISIDETTGEARDVAEHPPQLLPLDECPLYPANPLFTSVDALISSYTLCCMYVR